MTHLLFLMVHNKLKTNFWLSDFSQRAFTLLLNLGNNLSNIGTAQKIGIWYLLAKEEMQLSLLQNYYYWQIICIFFFSETLRAYFSKFGEIADSVIMMNKVTGQPRYCMYWFWVCFLRKKKKRKQGLTDVTETLTLNVLLLSWTALSIFHIY